MFRVKFSILLIFVFLLTGCASLTGQTPVPTIDVEQTLNAARTQAAMTVAAEIASQATATPLPPTPTIAPTATELPSPTPFPTFTPLPPQPTATNTLIPFTPTITNTSTPTDYNCNITFVSPAPNTSYDKNADFDAKWTLKNTGTQDWNASDIDVKYVSGEKMHKYNDVYDLAKNVGDGESIDIIVDMKAPNSAGTFRATWGLFFGTRSICQMSVTIVVK